jgi:predicted DCC family thiol-disulfide oxidoreductase YuxK
MFRACFERKTAYLLYDADCGPCTLFMRIVKRFDIGRKIIPVALQVHFAADLVRGKLSDEEAFRSFHLVQVSKDGKQIFSAGDGLVQLLEYLPFGDRLVSVIRRVKIFGRFVDSVYLQASRIRKSSCDA